MKLSELQLALLVWLSNGNLLEVCTEKGIYKGKTNGLQTFNGRCCKRTFNRLKIEELVYTKPILYFGIRWERYFVTDKGIKFVKSTLIKNRGDLQHA